MNTVPRSLFQSPPTRRSLSLLLHRKQPTTTRSSSSSTSKSQLPEWLALIPDHPNTLSKRKEIRPTHLARIDPFIKDGTTLMGGAMLNSHPTIAGQFPDMKGSVIVLRAANREEAVKWLSEDPYAKSGVWDLESMTLSAFRSAFRVPS